MQIDRDNSYQRIAALLALSALVGACGKTGNDRPTTPQDANTAPAGLVVIPPVPEQLSRMAADASLNAGTDAFYVSDDGSIVVGRSSQRTPGPAGPPADVVTYRWTAASGSVDLTSGAAVAPGAVKLSAPLCVAADGSAVVLTVNQDAYRWTQSSGSVKLSFPFAVGDPFLADASCTVFVGRVQSAGGDGAPLERAVRWTESAGVVELGQLAAYNSTHATGISRDGSVVFGSAYNGAESEPFRWTEATGIVGLGRLPGSLECGRANQDRLVADPDAMTIAGQCRSSSSDPTFSGFVWTEALGMKAIGALADGVASAPTQVSADGSTVAGESSGVGDLFDFRWTQAGLAAVGPLPGDAISVLPAATRLMSFDGGVVTGLSGDRGLTPRAFRWTAAAGPTALAALPGDVATDVVDVSPDGTTVVGASYANLESESSKTSVLWDEMGTVHRLVDEVPPEFEGSENDRRVELISLGRAQIADDHGKVLYGTAVLAAERGPALRAWVARLP